MYSKLDSRLATCEKEQQHDKVYIKVRRHPSQAFERGAVPCTSTRTTVQHQGLSLEAGAFRHRNFRLYHAVMGIRPSCAPFEGGDNILPCQLMSKPPCAKMRCSERRNVLELPSNTGESGVGGASATIEPPRRSDVPTRKLGRMAEPWTESAASVA